MKTIEERAREYASDELNPNYAIQAYIASKQQKAYIAGATEQKAIDIDKACNIFCYTGCPHKTDSHNCLNDKCDTWKIFRRMMEK